MRFVNVLLLTFLIACSSKQTAENLDADSTQVIQDSIPAERKDTTSIVVTIPAVQPIVERKAEPKDPGKKTLRCKFQNFEQGDCPHLIFDCADFGDAVIVALPKAQADVWNNLIAFEEHGDFPVANPKYVGKTFEIVHNSVEAKSCDPSKGSVKVPNILSFKIISN